MCTVPVYDAVISVELVTPQMRASWRLPGDAVLAIVERCAGQVTVLSADTDCPRGIVPAARAWAEALDAAFAGVAI